jgi:hypothetical protein
MSDRRTDIFGRHTAITAAPIRAGLAALTICVALVGPAQAETSIAPPATSATITPSLSPNRLDARAALTFTIRYAGGAFGVPSPVRHSILRFPAGLSLSIPKLSSCAPARLLARGAGGCPARSQLGHGHALVEAHAGSLTITEDATLWAFLGPPQNLQPTFEILGQGYTPVDERMVLTGTVLTASPPYGEELVMSIPPISTLIYESDASIAEFSLTIGADRRRRGSDANAVLIPSSCPAGGLPFAAEFTYADGSSDSALAAAPCPL